MLSYYDALTNAMTWLGEQPNTIFFGQAVCYPGTGQTNTLKNIDPKKKIEAPVCEEMQLGQSIGLSLAGFVPVSLYPRLNFLLCAMNQLVNHMDKYPLMSGYRPKVIVRVGIGASKVGLDPQDMHKGDFTDAIRSMCSTINVVKLETAEEILPAYQKAYHSEFSTILVEHSDYLSDKYYFEQMKEKFGK